MMLYLARFLLLAAPVAVWHCGYAVVDTARPYSVERIAVMPFTEAEPVGIAGVLADRLAHTLRAAGTILTTSRSDADAVLRGEVLQARVAGSPTSGAQAAIPAYGLTLRLRAELVDRDGKILWRRNFSLREDFLPAGANDYDSAVVNEANRRRALMRATEAAARQIHQRLILDAAFGRADKPAPVGNNEDPKRSAADAAEQ